MNLGRWLILVGCVILVATGLFHATGYASVSAGIEASGARPFVVSAVKALWLMFTVHLILVAVVALVASRTPAAGRIVLACACIPACDTTLLLVFAGLFAGTLLLALATLLITAGGVLLVRGPASRPGRLVDRPRPGNPARGEP